MKDTNVILDEKETINQPFLKPQIENNQNQGNSNQITDQYFVGPEIDAPKKMTISCEKCSGKALPYLLFLVLLDVFGIRFLFLQWYFIPIVIIIFIFTIFIFYRFTRKKVEIEKFENKNVISIKTINLLGCAYKQLELSHFYFHIGLFMMIEKIVIYFIGFL